MWEWDYLLMTIICDVYVFGEQLVKNWSQSDILEFFPLEILNYLCQCWTGHKSLQISIYTGFPQLLKNHWNSDLFQDHGKIIEFHKKYLKFVKMKKSWKNQWILDQLLIEKSLNSEINIVLTNYTGK